MCVCGFKSLPLTVPLSVHFRAAENTLIGAELSLSSTRPRCHSSSEFSVPCAKCGVYSGALMALLTPKWVWALSSSVLIKYVQTELRTSHIVALLAYYYYFLSKAFSAHVRSRPVLASGFLLIVSYCLAQCLPLEYRRHAESGALRGYCCDSRATWISRILWGTRQFRHCSWRERCQFFRSHTSQALTRSARTDALEELSITPYCRFMCFERFDRSFEY